MVLQPGNTIRIGVDLGGTKIEFVALERDGTELRRHRIATPRHDYQGTVQAIAGGVTKWKRPFRAALASAWEFPELSLRKRGS